MESTIRERRTLNKHHPRFSCPRERGNTEFGRAVPGNCQKLTLIRDARALFLISLLHCIQSYTITKTSNPLPRSSGVRARQRCSRCPLWNSQPCSLASPSSETGAQTHGQVPHFYSFFLHKHEERVRKCREDECLHAKRIM